MNLPLVGVDRKLNGAFHIACTLAQLGETRKISIPVVLKFSEKVLTQREQSCENRDTFCKVP